MTPLRQKIARYLKIGQLLSVLFLIVALNFPSVVIAQEGEPQTPSTTTAPTGSKALPGVTNSYSGKGVQASIEAVLCTPTNASYSPAETDGSTGTTAATSSASGGDLAKCINRLYRAALAFGSVSAVFFVVLAGYLYMVGGEKGKHRAKEMLLSVIVGIIIILASYTLLRQINPTLIAFRTIQPPQLTTQYDVLPTCEDLQIGGIDCAAGEGEDVSGDPETPGTEKGGITFGGSTFRNFPRFGQCDSPWGPVSYGSGLSTYCAGGCGPTSFAAIIKYFALNGGTTGGVSANSITPQMIGDLAIKGGYRKSGTPGTVGAFVSAIAPKFGLKATAVSWDGAVAALQKGTPVHISSDWKGGGFNDAYHGGHYIVLIAMKGDTIYVADSSKKNITAVKASVLKTYYNRGFAITSPKFTPPAP